MRVARYLRVVSGSAIAFALSACGTLQVAADVQVDGDYPLSFSDVREIERLLPKLRIGRPISQIYMKGPDHATVSCYLRTPPGATYPEEAISFTVVRRHGRWIPIDKPSVDRLMVTG
jgi:hypothetical protein